jgi:amidase
MDEAGFDRRRVLKLTGQAAAAVTLGGAGRSAEAASSDIVGLGARALSKAIAARKVSCAEVMSAHLDQIERLNPAHNAIVALQDRDGLMAQARAHDDRLKHGGPIGPLHGFPHAVKDLQPVKGIRFTRGSPIFKDFVAPADGLLAERLRAAGVIFIGKTNTPEFGFGSHTVNRVYGATHNAYDVSRSAGGSSGGAAVALALRMVPLADGSDYGGSLRNPAGWNNVCGFRTSFGCVPADGLDVWTPSMGVQGPMARNIADLSLLLSVQAGFDPRAPLSMAGDGSRFRDPKPISLKGKRIGWLGDFGGAATCEPGVLEVCRAALRRFEALGCVVEEARPAFDVETAWQAFMRLRAWQQSGQTAPFDKNPAQRAQLNDQALFELDLALKLSALDVTAASTVRTQWSAAIQQLFRRFDYLVAPTAQLFAFDVTKRWPTEIAGVSMRTYHEWMKGVCLVTLSGCPALAVPAGFSAAGQAMGIQIIAPVQQELACLQLGAAYEAVEPLWRTRPPPH